MSFLKKIQNQPEHTRKIIFWLIIIIVSLGLLFGWIKNFQKRLKSFKKEEAFEQFKMPSFEEVLKTIPEIDLKENLNKFKEIMKTEEKSE